MRENINICLLQRMNESLYYDFYPEWPVESVPGFGYLPVGVNKELDMMTQVRAQLLTLQTFLLC